jgi:2-polyprenyl-3-methyl-5-hydroxy-6-metoxy-1,4-benzoquinol methylase
MSVQVAPTHYHSLNYDTKKRFMSYWNQINTVATLDPKHILEVGVGNGFFKNYFKKLNYTITSVDLDGRLNPDVTASVTNLPFGNNEFDVVTCFEVLEHLPFADMPRAMAQLCRVSKRHIVLSFPDAGRFLKLFLKMPKIQIKLFVPLPFLKKSHVFDNEHFWELNTKQTSIKDVESVIYNAKIKQLDHFRPFECPDFHFFVLEK